MKVWKAARRPGLIWMRRWSSTGVFIGLLQRGLASCASANGPMRRYRWRVKGRLEVIQGCMFSGKTTELLRRLGEAEASGLSVAAVSPARDTRYGGGRVSTHTGLWRAAEA